MAEKVKQTLFRFRNMRAPQLLSDEAKQNYFIQHPDGTSGDFFDAVAGIPDADKPAELASVADGFDAKASREEVKAIAPELFEFAELLTQNRNSLTYDEVSTAIVDVEPLDMPLLLMVWDNLFYQTITIESGYVREALLQLIVAHHFVTNYGSMEATDEAIQKWANARVVMPMDLFAIPADENEGTTLNDNAPGYAVLGQYLSAAKSKLMSKTAAKAAKELEAYKETYYKINQKIELDEVDTFQAELKDSLDGARTVDEIDQFSGYTFKKIVDYIPTDFTYTRPSEVDEETMSGQFTDETVHFLSSNGLFGAKSFEELEGKITDLDVTYQKEVFDNTPFQQENISVDGTLISKCGIDKRFNQPYTFIAEMVEKSAGNYGVLLSIDVGEQCLEIDTIETRFSGGHTGSYKVHKAANLNGILTADLTPDTAFRVPADGVGMTTQLKFKNGLVLDLPMATIEPTLGVYNMATSNADSDGKELFIPSDYGVTQLGIADYRKVEQTLCCYVPGEVSHIENVMAREYKERSTRRLRRSDKKTSTSSSVEKENMTDTSTTSRFDMQQQISEVLSKSREFGISGEAHAGISGVTPIGMNYEAGVGVSANFATSASQENSENEATNFAKDVTQKALERVVSNVKEDRVVQIVEEFEENNKHGFDNRQGADHISGVYRWVDKVYKNEILNYGKRLQYEFMIPEPSAFHLLAKSYASEAGDGVLLSKPLDPRKNNFGSLDPIRNSAHILESNYHQWAAAYDATVLPAPDKKIVVGKTLIRPQDGSVWHETKVVQDQIVIPEGYGIKNIYISAMGNGHNSSWERFVISVAGITKRYWSDSQQQVLFADDYNYPELIKYQETVPISAQFTGFDGGIVSISVELYRKHSLMEEWQLDTFNSIISAYNERLDEYRNVLAEVEAKKGVMMKDNPAYHRRIENTVLKKNCIAYLMGHSNIGKSFITGDEIHNNQVQITDAMDKYSAAVKFFEQAFEWEIMDYIFYPFYWANKNKWASLYGIENDDEVFRAFLRSGMARSIVTVRPGFEQAVMYYMSTGLIWNGGEVPVMGDDLYLSIIEELDEPEYTLEETWESRVPSTLTLIQAKTIALEADGLPCYCDDDTPPVETIAEPAVNPLDGLNVHIDGAGA